METTDAQGLEKREYLAQKPNTNKPINNAVVVQEAKSQDDFRGIKTGSFFGELTASLDLEHQISATDTFHDKEKALLR